VRAKLGAALFSDFCLLWRAVGTVVAMAVGRGLTSGEKPATTALEWFMASIWREARCVER